MRFSRCLSSAAKLAEVLSLNVRGCKMINKIGKKKKLFSNLRFLLIIYRIFYFIQTSKNNENCSHLKAICNLGSGVTSGHCLVSKGRKTKRLETSVLCELSLKAGTKIN